jgi:hypothetical protein
MMTMSEDEKGNLPPDEKRQKKRQERLERLYIEKVY